MSRFWSFIKTAVLGGVTVLLPAAILVWLFQWVFRIVANAVRPLSELIASWLRPLIDTIPFAALQNVITEILAVLIILTFCFAVGLTVKTRMGGWLFSSVENSMLRVAPGYTMVKDIVMQLFGNKKPPFSRVGMVKLFGGDTYVTTFVTDEHDDGSFTVFMPTAPNPTSGWVFHVPPEDIKLIDVSVEATMRTVISCGVGSQPLIHAVKDIDGKESEA